MNGTGHRLDNGGLLLADTCQDLVVDTGRSELLYSAYRHRQSGLEAENVMDSLTSMLAGPANLQRPQGTICSASPDHHLSAVQLGAPLAQFDGIAEAPRDPVRPAP